MPNFGPKHAPIRQYLAASQFEQAKSAALRAMARGSDPGLDLLASVACGRLGLRDQSIFYARRAADAAPADADAVGNLGVALGLTGDSAGAVEYLSRAAALAPTQVQWLASLSAHQFLLGQYDEGVASCRAGLLIVPGNPELSFNLGAALADLGRHDEAAAVMRDACLANPDDLNLRTALCLSSHYAEAMTPAQVRAVHDSYNATLARQLRTDPTPFALSRDPGRKLRVGFVSGDLRRHSVAFFVEPLLQHADRAAFEFIAFSTAINEDDESKRLRTHFSAWHNVSSLTFEALTAKIRALSIDILVDLSGHTSNNSLVSFHLRGAPVQVTMIGYPGTTGLTQMDARIVDHITDPPEADAWHSERLIRLDRCFLCYRPPEDAPPPLARPPHTPVTFGSFNVLRKLGERTLHTWAQILHQVPESRLMLKAQGLSQPAAQAATRQRLKSLGIDESRIDLISYTPTLKEHLDLYARMDIALDPLVYNGTTTTCEALFMGVPVLTMRGPSHASRVGSSLLSSIGAPELIASDTDDYIAKAVALARARDTRDTYRTSLRDALRSSPLCDGPDYARHMQQAFRALWARWCSTPLN